MPASPPKICTAAMVDNTSVRLTWYSSRNVTETRTIVGDVEDEKLVYERVQGGGLEARTVRFTREVTAFYDLLVPVLQRHDVLVPLQDLEAYSPEGEAIHPEQIVSFLSSEKAVIVSSDRHVVDPFYLALLRADALVLVSRYTAFPNDQDMLSELDDPPPTPPDD